MDSTVRKADKPWVSVMCERLDLGGGRRLAFVHTPGRTPGVMFCGGFKSDMTGAKALALETFCTREGWAFTRFDYTGHGSSSGDFEDGTIGAWTDDAVAIIDNLSQGPQILAGSSMGGWIMVLAALARPDRVKGLVGIAAGPDFTEDLMWARASEARRAELMAKGRWVAPSAYGDQPYVITRKLIEEGRQHLVLRAAIDFTGPVHLLHGQQDPDVPWQTSLRLADALASEDVTVELLKSGDHRLSKPHEIDRICHATRRVVTLLA